MATEAVLTAVQMASPTALLRTWIRTASRSGRPSYLPQLPRDATAWALVDV